MNDYEEIRKRIINRKRNKLTDDHFNKFYNFMIKFMVVIVVCLSIASYVKVSPNMDQISTYLFHNRYFKNILPTKQVSVNQNVTYEHIDKNYYTNYSNEALNIKKGRVVYVGNQELLGNFVSVMLDDNIEITYGNLDEIFVELYDQVDINECIGTYNQQLIMIITQNNQEISYEEFLKLYD